ncbi:MAG: hypothetical protein IPP27_17590 [Bacteroidetes bacterium]|nr:hypothetical protein [Bacteroidota bacterium]MBL0033895.1 hypothetical protein [Bacteroidota bacterium]
MEKLKTELEFESLKKKLRETGMNAKGEEDFIQAMKEVQRFIEYNAGNLKMPSTSYGKIDSLIGELEGNIRIDPKIIIGIKIDFSILVNSLIWLNEEEVSKMRYR